MGKKNTSKDSVDFSPSLPGAIKKGAVTILRIERIRN